MNPEQRKNLHLNDKREWVEVSETDFKEENKEVVKKIQEGVKTYKSEMELKQKQEEASKYPLIFNNRIIEIPFKMEKWGKVEAKIKAKELENTLADDCQKEIVETAKKNLETDPKYYIKRNLKNINHMNK